MGTGDIVTHRGYTVRGKRYLWDELKKLLIKEEFSFDAYLDDIIKRYEDTGNNFYEISGLETKTGNPITIYFDTPREKVLLFD